VPIPPELVSLLREHLETFGTGPGGRLFRSENGNPIQPSTYFGGPGRKPADWR
jgi:hypothetical protein